MMADRLSTTFQAVLDDTHDRLAGDLTDPTSTSTDTSFLLGQAESPVRAGVLGLDR